MSLLSWLAIMAAFAFSAWLTWTWQLPPVLAAIIVTVATGATILGMHRWEENRDRRP